MAPPPRPRIETAEANARRAAARRAAAVAHQQHFYSNNKHPPYGSGSGPNTTNTNREAGEIIDPSPSHHHSRDRDRSGGALSSNGGPGSGGTGLVSLYTPRTIHHHPREGPLYRTNTGLINTVIGTSVSTMVPIITTATSAPITSSYAALANEPPISTRATASTSTTTTTAATPSSATTTTTTTSSSTTTTSLEKKPVTSSTFVTTTSTDKPLSTTTVSTPWSSSMTDASTTTTPNPSTAVSSTATTTGGRLFIPRDNDDSLFEQRRATSIVGYRGGGAVGGRGGGVGTSSFGRYNSTGGDFSDRNGPDFGASIRRAGPPGSTTGTGGSLYSSSSRPLSPSSEQQQPRARSDDALSTRRGGPYSNIGYDSTISNPDDTTNYDAGSSSFGGGSYRGGRGVGSFGGGGRGGRGSRLYGTTTDHRDNSNTGSSWFDRPLAAGGRGFGPRGSTSEDIGGRGGSSSIGRYGATSEGRGGSGLGGGRGSLFGFRESTDTTTSGRRYYESSSYSINNNPTINEKVESRNRTSLLPLSSSVGSTTSSTRGNEYSNSGTLFRSGNRFDHKEPTDETTNRIHLSSPVDGNKPRTTSSENESKKNDNEIVKDPVNESSQKSTTTENEAPDNVDRHKEKSSRPQEDAVDATTNNIQQQQQQSITTSSRVLPENTTITGTKATNKETQDVRRADSQPDAGEGKETKESIGQEKEKSNSEQVNSIHPPPLSETSTDTNNVDTILNMTRNNSENAEGIIASKDRDDEQVAVENENINNKSSNLISTNEAQIEDKDDQIAIFKKELVDTSRQSLREEIVVNDDRKLSSLQESADNSAINSTNNIERDATNLTRNPSERENDTSLNKNQSKESHLISSNDAYSARDLDVEMEDSNSNKKNLYNDYGGSRMNREHIDEPSSKRIRLDTMDSETLEKKKIRHDPDQTHLSDRRNELAICTDDNVMMPSEKDHVEKLNPAKRDDDFDKISSTDLPVKSMRMEKEHHSLVIDIPLSSTPPLHPSDVVRRNLYSDDLQRNRELQARREKIAYRTNDDYSLLAPQRRPLHDGTRPHPDPFYDKRKVPNYNDDTASKSDYRYTSSNFGNNNRSFTAFESSSYASHSRAFDGIPPRQPISPRASAIRTFSAWGPIERDDNEPPISTGASYSSLSETHRSALAKPFSRLADTKDTMQYSPPVRVRPVRQDDSTGNESTFGDRGRKAMYEDDGADARFGGGSRERGAIWSMTASESLNAGIRGVRGRERGPVVRGRGLEGDRDDTFGPDRPAKYTLGDDRDSDPWRQGEADTFGRGNRDYDPGLRRGPEDGRAVRPISGGNAFERNPRAGPFGRERGDNIVGRIGEGSLERPFDNKGPRESEMSTFDTTTRTQSTTRDAATYSGSALKAWMDIPALPYSLSDGTIKDPIGHEELRGLSVSQPSTVVPTRSSSGLSPVNPRKRYDDRTSGEGLSRQQLNSSPIASQSHSTVSTTSYVDAAIALERNKTPPKAAPQPEEKKTIPPVGPSEPSALTLALTRLADLESQMEFEYAKYMHQEMQRKILAIQFEHLQTLSVGFDAFSTDYEKYLLTLVNDPTSTESSVVPMVGS